MATDTENTLTKHLFVLDLVAHADQPPRFSDLLRQSPYPKGTLHRLIKNLLAQNLLSYQPQSQTYRTGLRLVGLAHNAWRQSSLAPVSRPFVDRLAEITGQTVHLAQLDGAHVLYSDKRNAQKPVQMFSDAGKIGPAYCTGVGKAMLAFLEDKDCDALIQQQSFYQFTDNTLTSAAALKQELREIRQAGYSTDREEHEPQIICVAAPILSTHGTVLGAVSVTASAPVSELGQLLEFTPDLHETARQIANASEPWHFPHN